MLLPIKHLISQGNGNLLPISNEAIARWHIDHFLDIKVEDNIADSECWDSSESSTVPYLLLKAETWDASPGSKSVLCPPPVTTHPHISGPRFSPEIQLQDPTGSWMSPQDFQAQYLQNLTVDTHSSPWPQPYCSSAFSIMARSQKAESIVEIAQVLEFNRPEFKSWLCHQP